MKRIFFTTLMFVVLSSLGFAQTLTLHFSGQVTNSATGAPIVNHQVFISSDSANPALPFYYAVATTNPNGVYQANITLTNWVPIVFHVYTYDCNGQVHTSTVTNSNTAQLVVNFSICDGTQPPPCNAGFNIIPVTTNPNKFYFQSTSTGANQFICGWSFGDGASATGNNAYHIYNQAGTYTVCLTIYNSASNCWDSTCQTVTVAGTPPPPCNITFMGTPDSSNNQLWHFAGTSTNPNTNLLWSFGDGTNGNGMVTQHFYQNPGTYVVCAKVPGSNGTILCSSCDTIVVAGNPPLPCNASFNIIPVTTNPNKFYFQSTSTGASQFACYWSFGDGSSGTGNSTYHIYNQAGTYTVCLTILNQSINCIDTVCQTVIVGTIPPPCNANFTVIADSSNSSIYHFAATNPSLIGMYYWNFGDGSNGYGPVVQHQYLNAGTYVVCMVVSNTGPVTCTSCDTIVVGGTPPPPCNATFNAYPDSTNTGSWHFAAVSPNSGIFQWSFGDGSTGYGALVQHTYANPGYYVVCLHVPGVNGTISCSYCDTIQVTGITPPPCNAAFTAIQDSVNDHLFHFFANYPNSAGPFQWSFGDGTSGFGPLTHHVYQNAGYYVVCLQVISPAGQITCSECDTIQVTGNPVPTYHLWGHVFAGANTLLDKGKVRLFKLSMTNVGAQLIATTAVDSSGAYHFYNVPAGVYYIKAKPGPMSQYVGQFLPTYYPNNVFWGNATPVMIPPLNNPYNIILKPAQAPGPGPGMIGGLITQGFKLSGSGAPVSDVEILLKPTSGDPYIFAESNSNGEFNFNDLGYGTYEVYPEVTGLATIPAVITLSANNPAVNNLNMVITPNQIATAINDDIDHINIFNVYPNPATSTINLELATEMPVDAVLSITDLTGRLIYTENVTLTVGKQKFTYDLSDFDSGTYFMQLRSDQGFLNCSKFSVIK